MSDLVNNPICSNQKIPVKNEDGVLHATLIAKKTAGSLSPVKYHYVNPCRYLHKKNCKY